MFKLGVAVGPPPKQKVIEDTSGWVMVPDVFDSGQCFVSWKNDRKAGEPLM